MRQRHSIGLGWGWIIWFVTVALLGLVLGGMFIWLLITVIEWIGRH